MLTVSHYLFEHRLIRLMSDLCLHGERQCRVDGRVLYAPLPQPQLPIVVDHQAGQIIVSVDVFLHMCKDN